MLSSLSKWELPRDASSLAHVLVTPDLRTHIRTVGLIISPIRHRLLRTADACQKGPQTLWDTSEKVSSNSRSMLYVPCVRWEAIKPVNREEEIGRRNTDHQHGTGQFLPGFVLRLALVNKKSRRLH